MRVLIVGAGPTGLTAAIELARMGVVPDVVERLSEPSSFSRAVGILPSSLRLLQPSGATDRILEEGVALQRAVMFSGNKQLLDLQLVDPKRDYPTSIALAQNRTETILRDVFNGYGGEVAFGCALESLRIEGDIGIASFADSRTAEYDYIIGADGVRSAVRTAVGIEYTGFDLPGDWSIADVDTIGWPRPGALTACLLPKGVVVLVVPLEADRYRVVSSTPDALAALPLPMDIQNIRRTGTFRISIRQAKQYAKHPVYLAGDAAHCHSPAGGRGMNLGMSDAADLAARLIAGELAGYDAARHAAGEEIIAKSEGTRRIMTATSPAYRLAIRSVLTIAGYLPFMQRMLVKNFVDG